MKRAIFGLFLLVAVAAAVDVIGNFNVLGTLTATIVDFTSATATAPMKAGTALPGTCTVGQEFFKTDAVAGQNIYLCTAANTWTQVTGGSGGSPEPNMQYVVMKTDFSNTYGPGTGSNPAYFGDFVFWQTGESDMFNYSDATGVRVSVASVATSATSGNSAQWYADIAQFTPYGADSLYSMSNKTWKLVMSFRYPDSASYTNSSFRIGISDKYAGFPQRGVGVRLLAPTDSYFTYYAANDGTTWGSTLATAIAPDTNWHKLTIRSDGVTANKVWIQLDSSAEKSVCPSGCDLTLSTTDAWRTFRSFAFGIRADEAVAKKLELDYVYFFMDWGTR